MTYFFEDDLLPTLDLSDAVLFDTVLPVFVTGAGFSGFFGLVINDLTGMLDADCSSSLCVFGGAVGVGVLDKQQLK